MLPELDDFSVAFTEFMASGQPEKLSAYCELGANLEIFNIYRNGYYRSTIDALVSNYPAVVALLGDDYFRSLAKHYVNQYPPATGTLVGYGKDFASFLDEHSVSQQLPYLCDIAKMDRAWIEVYFAVDSQPITAEEISALVEGDADIGSHRLGLCASTSLVSLNYGVTEIWQTLKAKHHLNDVTKLSKKSAYALIWRQHASVLIRPLPSAEFIFLSSLNAGSNLGQAAELAMEEDTDFDLADLFSNLITAGLLTTTATQAL